MIKTGKIVLICIIGISIIQCSNNTVNSPSASTSCFDTIYPVIYNCKPAENGDYAFRTIPAKQLAVKLLPNMETREKMQMKELNGVSGIHEFFLDLDLVSGFVHPYTQNMFNGLKPTDFVLKYKPDTTQTFTGLISYIHKNDIGANDTLGRNIAFFRQWRLSEINYSERNGEVYIKTDICTFDTRCACPQSKKAGNMTQIPFWQVAKVGIQPLNTFSAFGNENGGTVVIVWEENNEIFFQDIHSSWKEVMLRAIEISKKYNTDPAICISDAGPFARKLRADKNFRVNTKDIDDFAYNGKRFGAGYGYISNVKITR